MSDEQKQGNFEGWAVVEMMGHRKEIGFVTTRAFGQAVLFQVDTPEIPEREYALPSPTWATVDGGRQWCPAGTKVKREGVPARSCFVAPASLYAMNPCSEDAALRAIEAAYPRDVVALEVPAKAQIAPTEYSQDDSYRCEDCNMPLELCNCEDEDDVL